MNFDQMMAELRKDYVNSIPEKIQSLEKHYASMSVADLQNDFHKLKGTGKTYGLPEVSDLGLMMEKICKNKPDQLPTAMPLALKVLQKVHDLRLKNLPVETHSWEEFLALRQIESP